MTEIMIEKMVRALALAQYKQKFPEETSRYPQAYSEDYWGDKLGPEKRSLYEAQARTVLEALMEPTEGMKEAWFDTKAAGGNTYSAMIQAALDGK